MSSDPLKLREKLREEYHARWEAVETFKAHELPAMMDERARQIIQTLGAIEGWRERPGLVGTGGTAGPIPQGAAANGDEDDELTRRI